MNTMQMPDYLPNQTIPSTQLAEGTEEFQSIAQNQADKVSSSTELKMAVSDHDLSSGEKVSKVTTIVAPKVQVKQSTGPVCKDVKLNFRIEWKNENRNIVPNLINQMISFILKKIKSHKLVKKMFDTLPHDPNWTEKRFYFYMKKIKESITHYVN